MLKSLLGFFVLLFGEDGGRRSHALRGALNALPILRALRDAARALQRDPHNNILTTEGAVNNPQRSLGSSSIRSTLPSPEFCSATFCGLAPNCMTAFVPNLGPDLGNAIVTDDKEPKPRKGASHFLDDPIKQIRNLDVRMAPLGYIDRKYGYRLSVNDAKKKHKKKEEDLDAATTTIAFSMTGSGPLVLCEPPCFIDSCSKNRKMPFVDYVTFELDGERLEKHKLPQAVEVGGPFCKVIAGSVSKGDHTLRLSTTVVSPEHIMFSAVISFS